jgi:nucleoid-associated protein YgaU
MGSTAKLMLVGILVLVIVVALVWEKQSTDVQRMTVDNSTIRRLPEVRGAGGFAGGISTSPSGDAQAANPSIHGAVTGKQGNTAEMGDDFESQTARGGQKQPTTAQPANQQALTQQQAQPVAQTPTPSTHHLEFARDGKAYYTAQDGDVLSIISQKVYGTSKRWQEIRDANESLLHGDEKSLRPGMKLLIPGVKKN